MEYSNANVSVECESGTYKDDSLFTCQSCGSELIPNADKTACGKSTYQIRHQIQIYHASNPVTDKLLNVNFLLLLFSLITNFCGVSKVVCMIIRT